MLFSLFSSAAISMTSFRHRNFTGSAGSPGADNEKSSPSATGLISSEMNYSFIATASPLLLKGALVVPEETVK